MQRASQRPQAEQRMKMQHSVGAVEFEFQAK